jgi:hypothetical protein
LAALAEFAKPYHRIVASQRSTAGRRIPAMREFLKTPLARCGAACYICFARFEYNLYAEMS